MSTHTIQALRLAQSALLDAAWVEGSHSIELDSTIMFHPGSDLSQTVDSVLRQEFHGVEYGCVIWPGRRWTAYCTYQGSTWFEAFSSSDEARTHCMRFMSGFAEIDPVVAAWSVLQASIDDCVQAPPPVSPADLAYAFWSMDSFDQAAFFQSLAMFIRGDGVASCGEMQWHFLAQELKALPEARETLMSMAAPHYLHTLRAMGEPV